MKVKHFIKKYYNMAPKYTFKLMLGWFGAALNHETENSSITQSLCGHLTSTYFVVDYLFISLKSYTLQVKSKGSR